ncbi:hypothetical protein PHSC3_001311 [Chlamydiales bacterium STE3]|nr:hypothetical protein PHSC3_001311 [Chlamydiales bacterium STE3]
MFKDFAFYLTHAIETPEINNRRANTFLTPVRSLLHWRGKTIRYFKVNNESGKVLETHSPRLSWHKIHVLACAILCALPGLLIGSCLMKIALRDRALKRSYTLLKMWLPNEKGNDDRQLFPIPNKLANKIISLLSEKDKIALRSVNHSAKIWMDTYFLKPVDRMSLKGLTKETNGDFSIMNLTADCYEYQKKHYKEDLLRLFGGFKNILKLPLIKGTFTKEGEDFCEEFDKFAQSAEFTKLPNIFRLHVEKDPLEQITIKYTFLIPKEMAYDGREHAWHDYLTIRRSAQCTKDARSEFDTKRKRRSQHSFSNMLSQYVSWSRRKDWSNPIVNLRYLIGEKRDIHRARKDFEKLKDLINNKPLPVKYQFLEKIPDPKTVFIPGPQGTSTTKTIHYSSEDCYKTTHCRLGHLTLQEMQNNH